jgi:hypothetical protein
MNSYLIMKTTSSILSLAFAKQRFLPMGPIIAGYAPNCEPESVINAV